MRTPLWCDNAVSGVDWSRVAVKAAGYNVGACAVKAGLASTRVKYVKSSPGFGMAYGVEDGSRVACGAARVVQLSSRD